jgi:hypothetical protein
LSELERVGAEVSAPNEHVIDGSTLNKLLDPFNFEAPLPNAQLHHMLPGQVFDTLQKKFIKTIVDQIEKTQAKTVRFINLEAIASGPHKDYLYPICAALTDLIDSLAAKNINITGTIQNPHILPWNIVAKIDRNFNRPSRGTPAK